MQETVCRMGPSGWMWSCSAAYPRADVDPDDLADALMAVFEGSFILSKTMEDPRLVPRQLRGFRQHLQLLLGVGA